MSIERELREIKAEVEKLERVAGSKVAKSTVELEDLTDRQQNAIDWWEHALSGKVVSIVEDGIKGLHVHIRVRDTKLERYLLDNLANGPGFWSIDFTGKIVVINF